MYKNEIRTLPNTVHKNKFKMYQRPKCETGYYKICMETQKTLNRQGSLEEEKGTGGIGCPDFRLKYYKAMVIKRVWPWCNKKKYRQVK